MNNAPTTSTRLIHSRLVFLGLLASLFFGFPLVTLARGFWIELPAIFIYLYFTWFILIILAYLLQRRTRIKNENMHDYNPNNHDNPLAQSSNQPQN